MSNFAETYNLKEMGVSERIRQIRKKIGLSQEEFAKMLDTTASTISRTERKKRIPRVQLLLNIARKGGVSLDWLLTGKEAPYIKEHSDEYDVNREYLTKLEEVLKKHPEMERLVRMTLLSNSDDEEILKALATIFKQEREKK